MFIVLEGIDGCGKSTHSRLLTEWIESEGGKAHLITEPTQTKLGLLIREVLSGEYEVSPHALALLFTADRMNHQDEIREKIGGGNTVVCVRYYYSTIAYQSAQGVDEDWLKKINEHALKPDLALLLDIPVENACKRYSGCEVFEKKRFLTKVRENYLKFSEMRVIDSSQTIESTRDGIRREVDKQKKKLGLE